MLRPACLSVFALVVSVACSSSSEGDDKPIPTAQCSTSAAKLTAEDCATLGKANGCLTSGSDGAGGCTFEKCDEPPSCQRTSSSGGVDAGRDPRCDKAQPNGLFASDPPCANPAAAKINGVTTYYCTCTSACPCGYQCGSIALDVGGFIGNACAPLK